MQRDYGEIIRRPNPNKFHLSQFQVLPDTAKKTCYIKLSTIDIKARLNGFNICFNMPSTLFEPNVGAFE